MGSFHRGDWLSFAQAVGSVLAIAGAYGVVAWQNHIQRRKDEATARERQALSLLSLQALAAELAQMCTLSGLQREGYDSSLIYPDIPKEFSDMAERLDRFPLDRAVECGKMEQVLALRRVSSELAILYRSDSHLTGHQFVERHRTKLFEARGRAGKISIALDNDIEALAPGAYSDRIRRHL